LRNVVLRCALWYSWGHENVHLLRRRRRHDRTPLRLTTAANISRAFAELTQTSQGEALARLFKEVVGGSEFLTGATLLSPSPTEGSSGATAVSRSNVTVGSALLMDDRRWTMRAYKRCSVSSIVENPDQYLQIYSPPITYVLIIIIET
jgi:hypothetical protein